MIERSAYVLFAGMAVILLLLFWQPLPYAKRNIANTTDGNILPGVLFPGCGMIYEN